MFTMNIQGTGLFVLFCMVLVQETISESVTCGCFAMCDKKYNPLGKGLVNVLSHQRAAGSCRGGCRFQHQYSRGPDRSGKNQVPQDVCINHCASSYQEMEEQLSCEIGCRNTCPINSSNPPRLRVTIFVEDESADGVDGEMAGNDPSLMQQVEIISYPVQGQGQGDKSKLPASYFTDLPRRKPGGCTQKMRTCDTISFSEPVIYVGLLVIFGAVIYHVFLRKVPTERVDYNQLPTHEKTPPVAN